MEIQQSDQQAKQHYERSPEMREQQLSPNQYTPPLQSDDDIIFSQRFDKCISETPPLFAYHTYPAPEDIQLQPHHAVSDTGDWSREEDYQSIPINNAIPRPNQQERRLVYDGGPSI